MTATNERAGLPGSDEDLMRDVYMTRTQREAYERILAASKALSARDAQVGELVEALKLADAALSGANMDMRAVEKRVRAALNQEPTNDQ